MTIKDYLLAFVGCFLIWAIGTILHDRDTDTEQQNEIIELRSSINVLTEKNIRLDEELLKINSHDDDLNKQLSALSNELNNRLTALEELNKKKVKK
jgi:septal ring factor EnvC (AmiA/AmiB activator)